MESLHRARATSRILAVLGGVFLILFSIFIVLFLGERGGMRAGSWLVAVCFMLIGIILLWSGLRPQIIALTDSALEVRRGKSVKQSYPYSQMKQVRMVARRRSADDRQKVRVDSGGDVHVRMGQTRYKQYPELQIEGDFKNPYVLGLNYKGPTVYDDGSLTGGQFSIKTPYNTHAIISELVSRLPSDVAVDAAVSEYAATGEDPDATALPVENPNLLAMLGG